MSTLSYTIHAYGGVRAVRYVTNGLNVHMTTHDESGRGPPARGACTSNARARAPEDSDNILVIFEMQFFKILKGILVWTKGLRGRGRGRGWLSGPGPGAFSMITLFADSAWRTTSSLGMWSIPLF